MQTLRIALRYLFSRKTHTAVNVISLISVGGVAVATMAIVVVLSVFNGFSDLFASHISAVDPDLKVTPVEGKVIPQAEDLCKKLSEIEGVAAVAPAIDERALLVYGDKQMAVKMKAVPSEYGKVCDLSATILKGEWLSRVAGLVDSLPAMLVSTGVAAHQMILPSPETAVNLYVPRRVGRINVANPASSFRESMLVVTGVTQVMQGDYDADHVFVPLDVARDLLDYTDEATSVDIAVSPAHSVDKVKKTIAKELGDVYKVSTRMEQQEQAFRMMSIEKWMTFAMLAFILVIAAFNIISTLSLLVIEKHDNILTMRAIGASRLQVTSIFVWQGWLISIAGGLLGIVLGVVLSLIQQYGKLIKLAADPSLLAVDAYPVRLSIADVAVVFVLVVIVGAITSQVTRLFLRKYR